jgi:hypothetical protein
MLLRPSWILTRLSSNSFTINKNNLKTFSYDTHVNCIPNAKSEEDFILI